MNEQTKTAAYVGVAVAVLAIAFFTRPTASATSQQAGVPEILNEIENPLTARSMKIIEFDETTSTPREFSIAEVDDTWSIPSHENYPADAENQLGDAATSVMNLKVLGMVSHDASLHSDYGVIDPGAPGVGTGATGVGTRITMQDGKGDRLVNMIIGKTVRDQEGQRYVREVGRDAVYRVTIDPSKLSTKFEDWIEKDLLKISTSQIKQIELDDYAAAMEVQIDRGRLVPIVSWDRRGEMTIAYDGAKSEWSLAKFNIFDMQAKKMIESQMSDDQELNKEALDGLRDALDDLKIVDVARKPEGMSSDLKANVDFLKNREALASLQTKGYLPVPMPDSENELEILSAEGEVTCQMKDGVEYVLRFGAIAGSDGASAGEADAAATAGLNRYIFLLARYNDNVIAKPEIEELPALPESSESADAAADAETEGAEAKGDDAAVSEETDTAASSDESTADDAAVDSTDEGSDATDEGKAEPSEDEVIARITADRKRIEAENQRKLDAYNNQVEEAKEKVQKLNDRFGDWYFVISDDVYQKIHLSRDDIIKQKDAPEGEGDTNEGGPLQQLDELKNALPSG